MTDTQNPIRAVLGSGLGAAAAHNRRAVIDAIRVNGPLSRASLARATRLAKQTLSNIVEELEAGGLLVPGQPVPEGRGKPATPYDLAPMGALSIGLQIDRSVARTVVMNLKGAVVLRCDAPLSSRDPVAGLGALEALLERTTEALAATTPGARERIVGLGIAMPGPFGPGGATPRDDYTMAHWRDVDLTAHLGAVTGLDVALQNDAAAAAIAEKLTGRAHGLRDAVCLYLGYGLGAGLILQGELYGGRHGDAGEIGMIPLSPSDDGLLEHEVALAGFCERFGVPLDDGRMCDEIEKVLAAGGPDLDRWIATAAGRLGWVARMLGLVLAPQAIILCGTAPRSLLERLAAEANAPLLVGHADPWVVAMGAAAEPIARNFDPKYAALLKS
ncbi:ROK family transcriptional regulator [Salipiger sp. H15]|uniref:ROK family transcriptional regulator n=1 Tax=Alloyangia sp. H15 TaxID=3029062 RepID=A0AAU8ACM0_9RHOB